MDISVHLWIIGLPLYFDFLIQGHYTLGRREGTVFLNEKWVPRSSLNAIGPFTQSQRSGFRLSSIDRLYYTVFQFNKGYKSDDVYYNIVSKEMYINICLHTLKDLHLKDPVSLYVNFKNIFFIFYVLFFKNYLCYDNIPVWRKVYLTWVKMRVVTIRSRMKKYERNRKSLNTVRLPIFNHSPIRRKGNKMIKCTNNRVNIKKKNLDGLVEETDEKSR